MASGILNAARQSGGALSVALLGSLLGSAGVGSSGSSGSSGGSGGSGHALNLHVPLAVAAGGYLLAVALAWITIRGRS